MRVGRLVLVVTTLVAILVFPLMLRDAVGALQLPNAYAAPNPADAGGRVYQSGNTNGNNNGNNNDNNGGNNDPNNDDNDNRNGNKGSNSIYNANKNNNESDDNDNAACYANLNSNEEVPCDDNGNSNGNDNYYAPAPAAPAPAASSGPSDSRCFSTGETGQVVLNLSGGSVVVSVVGPGLPSSSRVGLETISDTSAIASPPGGATTLDSLIWRVTGTNGCDGGSAGQITGDVNLGIPYSVSANKAKLQIVYLQNGQWVEVPTVADPDPNKPYISATIRNAGIYAVIQKP